MYFEQFYLGCLAHASYMLGSQGEAVVVDPQRDVDLYLKAAEEHGLAIRHIMNQEGAGGDCFGVNEMYLALLAGTNPKTLVLNGSNKQTEELEMAIQNGLCINIDATVKLAQVLTIPVFASGGLSSLADIEKLCAVEEVGIEGVICGRAIYSGELDFAAAQARADELAV